MIPLNKPGLGKDELKEVKAVFDSQWIAGQGPKCKELETEFANYIGTKYAIAVGNCTEALHLALLALGIKEGDEVLVPDYTFPATAHAVLYVKAKPVFVDVSMLTFAMCESEIKKKITKNTKAIIIVHPFGRPGNILNIMKLAKRFKLKVIEDCACSAGAEVLGKKTGSFGDIGCFSFHGRKVLTAGEGGMITTNHKQYADRIRSLSCFGINSAYKRSKQFTIPQFVELGYNYKLSDIQAGIALSQLRKLDNTIVDRNVMAAIYTHEIKKILGPMALPLDFDNGVCTYQTYVILIKDLALPIITKLRKAGIQANISTYALHRQPVYGKYDDASYPVTSYLVDHAIALPFYNDMSTKDFRKVISTLKKVLKC